MKGEMDMSKTSGGTHEQLAIGLSFMFLKDVSSTILSMTSSDTDKSKYCMIVLTTRAGFQGEDGDAGEACDLKNILHHSTVAQWVRQMFNMWYHSQNKSPIDNRAAAQSHEACVPEVT